MNLLERAKESVTLSRGRIRDILNSVSESCVHLLHIDSSATSIRQRLAHIHTLIQGPDGMTGKLNDIHATIGQFRQPVLQMAESMGPSRHKESIELLSSIRFAITNIAGALDAERSKARRKTDGGVAEMARIVAESRRMDVARHHNEKVRIDLRHAELLKAITDASNAHSHCSNSNRIKDDRTHSELMRILGRICDKIEGGK